MTDEYDTRFAIIYHKTQDEVSCLDMPKQREKQQN